MIFVFGSNLAGRHGAGAAKHAAQQWGAEYGIGEGPTGHAYAIPTKGMNLERLEWPVIHDAIERFVEYARRNQSEIFVLTPVGTGLAGHSKRKLWASLKAIGLPPNVVLSSSWVND